MEKTVQVDSKVEDLWGLYADLRRASFLVKNVGSDERGTYVYLDPSEEKDPTPIVEAWNGRPAPTPSLLLRDIRIKEMKKIEADEKGRLEAKQREERKQEEIKLKAEEGLQTSSINAGFPLKVGFFRKLLGRFF